jgi:hypothetical protein
MKQQQKIEMKIGKIQYFWIAIALFWSSVAHAQRWQTGYVVKMADGRYMVPAWVFAPGDTLLHVELEEFTVTAPRFFAQASDYNRYNLYRRLAPSVFPYAVEAVRIYREMAAIERDKTRKDKKKFIEKLSDELDEKFRSKLKNMTKTQGHLLIKMIERETQLPFYDIVKDVKGGLSAWSWQQFGRVYGYDLRAGYHYGDDPILDAVLKDFPIVGSDGVGVR